MQVAILLFERLTALDAIGPYEVLARVPGWDVVFVARQPGPIGLDTGLSSIEAGAAMEDVPDPGIVVVPGGRGSRDLMSDPATLDWLRRASGTAEWMTSVCTGSLVLAAAGLLEGRRCTTHWLYLERLRELGAEPVAERVVIDGRFVTAAGVSAGIDMGLTLVAEAADPELAKSIQLGIEYDPEPPFDSGSPRSASRQTVDQVTSNAARRDEWLATRRGNRD